MNRLEKKINEIIRERYIEEIRQLEKDPLKNDELRKTKSSFVKFELTRNR